MDNLSSGVFSRLVVPESPQERTCFIIEFPLEMHEQNILEIVEVLKVTTMKKLNCMLAHADKRSWEDTPYGNA